MGLYVIDLETTGIYGYPRDKILELALVRINDDLSKELILDTLVSHPERYRTFIDNCWWSGLSDVKFDDLSNSPSMEEIWINLKSILRGERLTSWNVAFDLSKFIAKMEKRYGKIGYMKERCPMWASGRHMKSIFGRVKPPKLEEAANFYQIHRSEEDYHRARFDTLLAADVIIEMIKRGHY